MLARAFHDDPAFGYILPEVRDRQRRLTRLFALLQQSDARAGMGLTTGDGAAATFWRGPGRATVGWWEMLCSAPALLAALGPAIPRALAVSAAIDAHLPPGDFWYLHIAGCDPAAQGRRLGGKLIRAGLARAAGRLPCYLETATEKNLGFYRALGWEPTGEWRVGREGPRFWSMLRPPG
ncbi:acetyltransferase [Sphingomonas sp. Leaf412]|nr:acetyltransferase [Sphingomonas sp. Leaf412]